MTYSITLRPNLWSLFWWLGFGFLFQYVAYEDKPFSAWGLLDVLHVIFWPFFLVFWMFFYIAIIGGVGLGIFVCVMLWQDHQMKKRRKQMGYRRGLPPKPDNFVRRKYKSWKRSRVLKALGFK